MNPWENDRSFLAEVKDDLGRTIYEGRIFFQGVEFRVKLNPQNSGKYVYRGTVSAISPADGFIVQVKGREADRRLGGQKIAEKERRDKKLNLTAEVYTQATDCEGAKDAILRAVKSMYVKHAVLLAGELQKSVRPETITPDVAAVLFAETFVEVNYRNVNEETVKKYAKKIKAIFAEMPSVAMATYKQSAVKSFLVSQKIGKDTHRMLSNFWEYLILKGHVAGVNPFPPVEKKKETPGKKQQKAKKHGELTLRQQDTLYNYLMVKTINGGDCGVALLAWGNLPEGDEVLKWKDVIMDTECRDFVLIKYRRDDLAGATHNFIQPQTVQVARILWRQKEKLLQKYNERELLDMPVIALQKNPKKPMKMSTLIQYAGTVLRVIGIEEKVFAVQNKTEKTAVAKQILQMTHQKNIYHRYGLDHDEGTKQFLQLGSLRKSVTDDNYTSFSDKDAQKRIYVVQLAIRPYEKIHEYDKEVRVREDGGKIITVYPEHTRERVGVVCAVKVPPGATLTIRCAHGVTGEYRTREIKEDGSLRRKSKM